MKRIMVLSVMAVLIGASVTNAYDLNGAVTTDKAVYAPGETVSWTMYAWTSTDCPGVALLALNLLEDRLETLNQPDFVTHNPLPGFFVSEFTGSDYGLAEGFTIESYGNATQAGLLADVVVRQKDDERILGQGSTGDSATVFVQGSFVANELGTHNLSITVNGGNFWTGAAPLPAETLVVVPANLTGATFDVIPEPATIGLLLLGVGALIRRRK